jgi:hypothetical protein
MASPAVTIGQIPPATWHLTVRPSRVLRLRLKLASALLRSAAWLLNAEATITVEAVE